MATGDARVLHWLGLANPQLERTGIDLCPNLPQGPPGIDIRAGVAMERLPFEDLAFDAIVSQFGVEYGDTARVAAEVARVARDDARIAFIVHRGDGAILEHNVARAEQIAWLLDELDLIERTKAHLARENRPWPAAVRTVAEVVREGRARFGEHSAGWEIPEAVRRSLIMGAEAGDSIEGVCALLDNIAAQACNERDRIASLKRASATADARDTFLGAFASCGLTLVSGETLKDAAGRVFAEMLRFKRG
ncbi:hypothetical protein FHR91_001056 [Erythrobacter lutimaris]|nr:hypothetical protein [Alteriqipengyuania lutimaris]